MFVHFFFAALSFVPRAVMGQNAQGNFTTTTQVPALPMLRGTSYRKTERLTCSFSSENNNNPSVLHAGKRVTEARVEKKKNMKRKASYKILIGFRAFSRFIFPKGINWNPDVTCNQFWHKQPPIPLT